MVEGLDRTGVSRATNVRELPNCWYCFVGARAKLMGILLEYSRCRRRSSGVESGDFVIVTDKIPGEVVMDDETWMCTACGWLYEVSVGDPAHGVPAGTPWSEVPDDWVCPECGAPKDEFERLDL